MIFEMVYDSTDGYYVSEEDSSVIANAFMTGKIVRLHFNESVMSYEMWGDIIGYRPEFVYSGQTIDEKWSFDLTKIGGTFNPDSDQVYTNGNGKLVVAPTK